MGTLIDSSVLVAAEQRTLERDNSSDEPPDATSDRAQAGAQENGIHEVMGSIPISSTNSGDNLGMVLSA